jgi:hypothetical protein
MRIAPERTRLILSAVKEAYRFQAVAVVFVLAASALSSGCGGFSGSHSVSPATLLLPGLMRAEPAPAPRPGTPTNEVASRVDPTRQVDLASSVRVSGN